MKLDRTIWMFGLLGLSVSALAVDRVMQVIKVDQIRGATGNTVTLPAGQTLKVDVIQGATAGAQPPGLVPVGGMVAVMASTANAWQPPASGQCKDGFARADGVAFSAHPTCAGVVITVTPPNMIAAYPRGNTTSGATGGANLQASNVSVVSHSLSSINIPQLSTLYTPAGTNLASAVSGTINIGHTHAASTVSGSVGGTDGTHTHTITDPSHVHEVYTQVPSSGLGNGAIAASNGLGTAYYSNTMSSKTTGISINTTSSGHGHGFSLSAAGQTLGATNVSLSSGSAEAQAFTGTQATITVGTASPTAVTHSVTNNAVNNEPNYVEVVWVIRVK